MNGRIGVVELPGDKRSERSTKDTTVVRDFYLLDEVPEERDAFEKALGGIESSIAPVVRSVLDRKVWPLPPEERDNLARFATLQFLRGPNHREHINQMTAMMVRAELAGRGLEHEYLEHIAGLTAEIDPEDVEADSPVSLDKFQVQVPPIAHIDQMVRFLPKMVNYLRGRPWTLFRFDSKSILTCDTPVSLISDPRRPDQGTGLATAWGIAFPLSRKTGLLMGDPTQHIELGGVPAPGCRRARGCLFRPVLSRF